MALTSMARLEASRHIREDEVGEMLRTIYEKRSVDLKSEMATMISNVISRMILNKRHAGVQDPNSTQIEKNFPDMILTHFRLAGLNVPGDYIPALKWLDLGGLEAQMKEHGKRMDAFISDILSQHRERRNKGPVPKNEHDMVDVLLDQMEMKDAPFQLTEDNVKALILDAFLAATGSTIVATEWAVAELLRKHSLIVTAHSELDAVVGRDRLVQESDLHMLPHLQAVVKEAFRLHPVAPLLIPRESSQASQAFGYDFPAKTRVLVNVWAVGRDPETWQEPLLTIIPIAFWSRISGTSMSNASTSSCWPSDPGGVSMRVLVEQFVLRASCIPSSSRCRVDMTPEDLGMTECFGLTLPRAGPLPCIAKARLPPQLYQAGC